MPRLFLDLHDPVVTGRIAFHESFIHQPLQKRDGPMVILLKHLSAGSITTNLGGGVEDSRLDLEVRQDLALFVAR